MGVNSYGCLTAVSGGVVSGGLQSALRLPRVCSPPGWFPAVLIAHQHRGGKSSGFSSTAQIPLGSLSWGNSNLDSSPSIFLGPPMCQAHHLILVVTSYQQEQPVCVWLPHAISSGCDVQPVLEFSSCSWLRGSSLRPIQTFFALVYGFVFPPFKEQPF